MVVGYRQVMSSATLFAIRYRILTVKQSYKKAERKVDAMSLEPLNLDRWPKKLFQYRNPVKILYLIVRVTKDVSSARQCPAAAQILPATRYIQVGDVEGMLRWSKVECPTQRKFTAIPLRHIMHSHLL